jgi:hypothetical protein
MITFKGKKNESWSYYDERAKEKREHYNYLCDAEKFFKNWPAELEMIRKCKALALKAD